MAPGSTWLACARCEAGIASNDDLMTYQQCEKSVHLSIKPERVDSLVSDTGKLKRGAFVKKKWRVVCIKCGEKVGAELAFGPNNLPFVSFCMENVLISSEGFSPKDSWGSLSHLHEPVEYRDNNNFFGSQSEENGDGPAQKEPVRIPATPIVLPEPTKIESFRWDDILRNKAPRDYQLEAFVECLLRDTILVLPTGSGKTLVAAMVLGRMCLLNRDRLGLVVVDRIPLVFQHAQSIRFETDLRVMGLYGGNMNLLKINQVVHKHVDVLVITAGAYNAHRSEMPMELFHTVILDECHHASGNHPYVNILSLLKSNESLPSRQRFVGLTASPIESSHVSVKVTMNKFDKFRKPFPGSFGEVIRVIRPNANEQVQQEPRWIITAVRNSQKILDEQIFEFMNQTLDEFEDIKMNPEWTVDVAAMVAFLPRLVGNLRALPRRRCADERKKLRKLASLLDVVDLNKLMGTKYVKEILDDNEFKSDIAFEKSERLEKLDAELTRKSQDKNARILVFTSTKESARILHKYLLSAYPGLNPRRVVGRTGAGGMDWDGAGGQREAIDAFNDPGGQCRLLVATSILEEGLDVQSCDLVIRFAGFTSLITFIQTRGRARKEGSEFIAFLDENEQDVRERLGKKRRMLDMVVPFTQATPQAEVIIRALQGDPHLTELALERASKVAGWLSDEDLCVTIFVEGLTDKMNLKEVEKALKSQLRNINDVELRRLYCVEGSAQSISGCGGLFSQSARAFQAAIGSKTLAGSRTELYNHLCRSWNMKLDQFKDLQLFMTHSMGTSKSFESLKSKFAVNSVQTARIVSSKKIDILAEIGSDAKAWLGTTDGKQFALDFDKSYSCSISLASTFGFAFLKVSKEWTELIIPTKTSPYFYRDANREDEKKFRLLYSETEYLNKFISVLEHSNTLIFKFKRSDDSVRELFRCLPLLLLHSNIATTHATIKSEDAIETDTIFELRWKLAIVEDERRFANATKFTKEVMKRVAEAEDLVIPDVTKALDEIDVCSGFLTGFDKVLESVDRVIHGDARGPGDGASLVPEGYVMVKRLVLTPTRQIRMQPAMIKSNRLLRKFPQLDVIYVSFRDENSSKAKDSAAIRNFDQIARGFNVFGRHFEFLCASNSQLREQKAIFARCDSAEFVRELRNQILCNESQSEPITSVAKYITRVGLFATSDTPLLDIPKDRVGELQDVRARNRGLLTDGAGKIRRSAVCDLNMSAFICRYAGCKGVLTVVPDDDPDFIEAGDQIQMLLRPSMIKFDNDDTMLCMVKPSKYMSLTLNHEAVTLMESLSLKCPEYQVNGFLTSILKETSDKALERFTSAKAAEQTLKGYSLASQQIEAVSSSFELLREPFWLSLLRTTYDLEMEALRLRANLPVAKGAKLMAIPDPTNTLKDGQVFCHVSKEEQSEPIKGRILFYRNPCLHPGDLRVATAVANSKLEEWGMENVLVFPAGSDCLTSLAQDCSGGDLDGDEFSVIWEEALVPPHEALVEALDYGSLGKNAPTSGEDLNDQGVLEKFFQLNMLNDALGRVATMHLALCDLLPDGACDPLAMKLAESQSVAVDFPKTGIEPTVPKEALKRVKKEGYPDFMEKSEKKTYISKKVQGSLYRYVCNLMFSSSLSEEESRRFPFDLAMDIDVSPSMVEAARAAYKIFASDLKGIMRRFYVASEEEIVLATARKWHMILDADRGKASDSLKEAWNALVKKFKRVFADGLQSPEEMLQKASAWYKVVYDETEGPQERFFSFAWIATDQLCAIKSAVTSHLKAFSPEPKIGHNVRELFNENKEVTERELLKHLEAAEKLSNLLENEDISIDVYGSVSLFLCGVNSDIDLVASSKKPKSDRLLLQEDVHAKLNAIAEDVEDKTQDNMEVPRLSFSVPLDEGDAVDCDISVNRNGLVKTLLLYGLYDKDPAVFPAFWILVKWARSTGIIKCAKDDLSLRPTAEFYAFVLGVLGLDNELNLHDDTTARCSWKDVKNMWEKCLDAIKDVDETRVGKLVLTFFRNGSVLLEQDFRFTWPNGIAPVLIPEGIVKQIKNHCLRALHVLLVTRDMTRVIKCCEDASNSHSEFTRPLPRSLSSEIGKALMFFEERLKLRSGVDEIKLERISGEASLKLTARGKRSALDALRSELRQLSKKGLDIGRVSGMAYRYFMENSSLSLLFGGDKMSSLRFDDYHGVCQPRHRHRLETCVPVRKDPPAWVTWEDWKKEGQAHLEKKLRKQLPSFPVDKEDLLNSLEVQARFGTLYVLEPSRCLADTQPAVTVQELEEKLSSGRKSRGTYERAEFKVQPKTNRNFLMITLPKSSASDDATTQEKQQVAKVKKRPGMASSFISTVVRDCNLTSYNPENALREVEAARKQMIKALESCGFAMEESVDSRTWKIIIAATRAYEMNLTLDANGRLTAASERSLNWVHCSIIDCLEGKKDEKKKAHDIRITAQSAEKLSENHPLCQWAFKSGKWPEHSVVEKSEDGAPKLNREVLSDEAAKQVRSARCVLSLARLSDGECEARIAVGVMLEGETLNQDREFCDLSLNFDCDPLRAALKKQASLWECEKLAAQIIDKIGKVSVALNEFQVECNGM